MTIKQINALLYGLILIVLMACSGDDGDDGINGCDGEDGKDGRSCSVEPLKKSEGYKVILSATHF